MPASPLLTVAITRPPDATEDDVATTRASVPADRGVVEIEHAAKAWNAFVGSSESRWVAIVTAGAILEADALEYLGVELRRSDAAALYTDEAIGAEILKPGWSPRWALEGGYVGGLLAVRPTAVREVGGFTDDDVATFGLDLLLRISDAAMPIDHVAVVALQQSRHQPWPTTLHAREAAARVAQESLDRRGLRGTITPGEHFQRVALDGPRPPVSIVIPTRDRVELLGECIRSVELHTDYPDFEIVILDNDSVEPATLQYFRSTPHTVVPHPGAFNFSDLMNAGAAASKHPLLLLLNNDCTVDDPGWLDAMVSELADPTVAMVGCRLNAADGTPQHEGVGLGLRGAAALNIEFFGYWHFDEVARDVVGVTAACMLVRRDVFDAVGGFDHELAVGFGDVDFCLRVRAAGHRIIYTPHADVRHIGMATRRADPHREDDALFAARWPLHRARQLDPFVNPRLEVFEPLWATPVEAILGPVPTSTYA